MLSDLDAGIGRRRQLTDWLLPVDPGVYTRVTRTLLARHAPLTATDAPVKAG